MYIVWKIYCCLTPTLFQPRCSMAVWRYLCYTLLRCVLLRDLVFIYSPRRVTCGDIVVVTRKKKAAPLLRAHTTYVVAFVSPTHCCLHTRLLLVHTDAFVSFILRGPIPTGIHLYTRPSICLVAAYITVFLPLLSALLPRYSKKGALGTLNFVHTLLVLPGSRSRYACVTARYGCCPVDEKHFVPGSTVLFHSLFTLMIPRCLPTIVPVPHSVVRLPAGPTLLL